MFHVEKDGSHMREKIKLEIRSVTQSEITMDVFIPIKNNNCLFVGQLKINHDQLLLFMDESRGTLDNNVDIYWDSSYLLHGVIKKLTNREE